MLYSGAMHRVPVDLDLSAIIAIQSPIKLIRNGKVIGTWEEGRWPDSRFYETMNVKAPKWQIPDDRSIVIFLENGIEMHLTDGSDRYECMQISVEGAPGVVVI